MTNPHSQPSDEPAKSIHDISVTPLDSDPIRPHVFDGTIQEYDKRLPNWWLFTLYGSIAFALGYWVATETLGLAPDPGPNVVSSIARNTRVASARTAKLDDAAITAMTHDKGVTDAGQATFLTMCASCHMPDLRGGIGPNLKDATWIHGGTPLAVVKTITEGVIAKGMPTWGPILGRQKIVEVTAFILSQNTGIPADPNAPPYPGAAIPAIPGAPTAIPSTVPVPAPSAVPSTATPTPATVETAPPVKN